MVLFPDNYFSRADPGEPNGENICTRRLASDLPSWRLTLCAALSTATTFYAHTALTTGFYPRRLSARVYLPQRLLCGEKEKTDATLLPASPKPLPVPTRIARLLYSTVRLY